MSPDHPSEILFDDDYVVVGWDQNPAMQGEMTRELYFELGHVTARFGKARTPVFEDWFMRRQSQQRRVDIIAPSFLSVPGFIVGTNRISTMHRRLAKKMTAFMPLVIREAPLQIPTVREAVQWHISNNNDPAIRWMVERLIMIAKEEPTIIATSNVVPMNSAAITHAEIEQFRSASTPSGRK
jgi:LysR family transcriptional regulator, nod-box dependent transcriptional activator